MAAKSAIKLVLSPSAGPAARGPVLVYFGALAAIWLVVFYRLSFVWESSDQYSHGWLVPLLAAWIFWRRWMTRPGPAPTRHGLWVVCALILSLLLFPAAGAHLVLESSPDWRMMMWCLSGAAFVASLVLTELAGGAPWRRHLAFAFFFALVAVPWPYDFERWLTTELSLIAAQLTTIMLNFFGVLAICRGNTIELAAGFLGVDDACSGVRSFQSSFVVALLFGEWFLLRAGWRVFLCLFGLVVAYALNIGRMLLLAFAVENSDLAAVAEWHDPAGFAILVLTLGVLCLACLALDRIPGAGRPEGPASPLGCWGGVARRIIPAGGCVLAALVLMAATVEGWYRYHEPDQAIALAWSIAPATGGEIVDEPLTESLRRALGFDVGFSRQWKDDQNRSWEILYLRWEPGRKAATAGPHAPDYCQKAVGRTVLEKSQTQTVRVGDLVIPYQIYTIASGTQKFHLLFALNDGRRDSAWLEAGLMGAGSPRERRLNQVRKGHRNLGQASLQLSLVGVEDWAEAEREMLKILPSLIQP